MLLAVRGEMEPSIIVTEIKSIIIFNGTNIDNSGANKKKVLMIIIAP